MTYLTCFLISLFFAYLAKRASDKISFLLFSAISLVIPIMLATLRDYSIGVDTLNYLTEEMYWQGASSAGSLAEYMKYYLQNGSRSSEPLFALFMGIIAQTTGEYRIFLFFAQVVILIGIYVGAYRMKEHSDPVLTLLLFYLLYFNYTLNATRQYMSLAILFAAMHDIEEGKYKRYLFFAIVAVLIHNTSILGIPLMILYYLLYGRNIIQLEDVLTQQKRVSLEKRFVIAGLLIGAFFFFDEIARALINIGLLNKSYLIYLNLKSNASFLASRMFLLVEIIGLVAIMKSFRNNNLHPDFFIFCSLAFFLLFQLAPIMRTGARVARFFSIINICTIGMVVHGQRGERKVLLSVLVISIALMFWIYMYAYSNYSHTMPYKLGI